MRKPIILSLLCLTLLVGCQATDPVRRDASYPSAITDFGEFERFPAKVSGYRRGKVIAYARAFADYSVAYNSYSPVFQNAVTLYFYPRTDDPTTQLAAEKAGVLRAHPGARVTSERPIRIQEANGDYDSTVVTFEYAANFAGRLQDVSSQLIVVSLPHGTFKVRSTAPVEQGALAEAALRQLLGQVAWAR